MRSKAATPQPGALAIFSCEMEAMFRVDPQRRDHWHNALVCEYPPGCQNAFYFGGRHHCRGCGYSLCTEHCKLHTAPNSTEPYYLCDFCELRVLASQEAEKRAGEKTRQEVLSSISDSDSEIAYSAFSAEGFETSASSTISASSGRQQGASARQDVSKDRDR